MVQLLSKEEANWNRLQRSSSNLEAASNLGDETCHGQSVSMKADSELQIEGMINSLIHAGKAAFHLFSVSIRMQVRDYKTGIRTSTFTSSSR